MTAGTAKARFWLLAACWNWAQGQYQIEEFNPFKGFADRFQSTEPKQRPKPFTAAEIQANVSVAKALGHSPKVLHDHYADVMLWKPRQKAHHKAILSNLAEVPI